MTTDKKTCRRSPCNLPRPRTGCRVLGKRGHHSSRKIGIAVFVLFTSGAHAVLRIITRIMFSCLANRAGNWGGPVMTCSPRIRP